MRIVALIKVLFQSSFKKKRGKKKRKKEQKHLIKIARILPILESRIKKLSKEKLLDLLV